MKRKKTSIPKPAKRKKVRVWIGRPSGQSDRPGQRPIIDPAVQDFAQRLRKRLSGTSPD